MQLIAAVLISATDPSDSDAKHKLDLGKDLGVIGVAIQLGGFGLFTIAAVRFHFVSRKMPSEFAAKNSAIHGIQKHWSTLLLVVNASCALILVS